MNTAWLEAVIKGEGHATNGAVEEISLDGLYLRMRSQHFFQVGQRITIDLYLRDSNRRYIILKMQARVVRIEQKGAKLHFSPMTLVQHRTLAALIDFISAEEGSDRDHCEDILFTELLEDHQTE